MRTLVYIFTTLILSLSLEANTKQKPKSAEKVKKIHCNNIDLEYFNDTKHFAISLGDSNIDVELIIEIDKCEKGTSIVLDYDNKNIKAKELGKCSDKGFYVKIRESGNQTFGAWDNARRLDTDPINEKRFKNLAIKINETRLLKAYEHYNKLFNEHCEVIEFD
ncbi:hypothetical protein OQH61_04965 [Helicobacter sp. MIT 21-1697]|uniref:hypothetical protein n=1 Tax=Helicobacter sp. MIT 21-1697 TaxID=2993733 RepID=UPI00224A72FA|nr:hypothetical protein [Helicobacter sp. MIT 21-1697]MCX2717083.1 hypothetical protein [Helicobacter sp. MIT 21-1697]